MKKVPTWIRPLLLGGGILNLLLALLFLLMPVGSHQLLFGSAPSIEPQGMQFWGVLLAVLGVGYIASGANPYKNTAVLLMGLLANLMIAILLPALSGAVFFQYWALPVWTVIALGWCAAMVLSFWGLAQARYAAQPLSNSYQQPLSKTINRFRTQRGKSLLHLSNDRPTLVVFLRQLDSPFGNDTLEDIRQQRKAIESRGVQIVLVHQSEGSEAGAVLERYALSDLHQISDPSGIMYNAFGLDRSRGRKLLGWLAQLPELVAGVLRKGGRGRNQTGSLLMPGVFLISKGEIVRSYKHRYTSERPDYRQMAAGQAA